MTYNVFDLVLLEPDERRCALARGHSGSHARDEARRLRRPTSRRSLGASTFLRRVDSVERRSCSASRWNLLALRLGVGDGSRRESPSMAMVHDHCRRVRRSPHELRDRVGHQPGRLALSAVDPSGTGRASSSAMPFALRESVTSPGRARRESAQGFQGATIDATAEVSCRRPANLGAARQPGESDLLRIRVPAAQQQEPPARSLLSTTSTISRLGVSRTTMRRAQHARATS